MKVQKHPWNFASEYELLEDSDTLAPHIQLYKLVKR